MRCENVIFKSVQMVFNMTAKTAFNLEIII